MISTNDYYQDQFTEKLGYQAHDYLGREDKEIQDAKIAKDFFKEDAEVTRLGIRKWYKGVFIDKKKDTIYIATFKSSRIEFNQDTILFGIVFDLDKMKKELKLKDQ